MKKRALAVLLALVLAGSFAAGLAENGRMRQVEAKTRTKTVFQDKSELEKAALLLDWSGKEGENGMISPLSLNLALGMIGNGAGKPLKKDFEAYFGQKIKAYNRFAAQYKENTEVLKCANSVWVTDEEAYQIAGEFEQLVKDQYGAEVQNVNFAAPETAEKINGWISGKTEKMIPSVLDRTDGDMKMVLVNALYFGSDWDMPFAKEATEKQAFQNADGSESQVDMMHEEEWGYFENAKAEAIEKTYQNGDYSLIAVLPKEEGAFALKDLKLDQLLGTRREENVNVGLPKFTFSNQFDLKASLERAGLGRAFDSKRAGFDRLFEGGGGLFISDVIQATKVRVDEMGTEAAAATVIAAKATALVEPPKKEIVFDRPFAFLLMDNQRETPLFIGKVVKL